MVIPDLDLVAVHAMNNIFGMTKNEDNGFIISSSFIYFCGLIYDL